MAARDTVVDGKKAFITSESRLLNAPLEIPYHWHNRVVSEEDSNLGAGVIDEVLEKLNTIARHHNKAAYSLQTIRHVAEQIDALYWASGDPVFGARVEECLEKELDLRKDMNMAKLPEHWLNEHELGEDEYERYHKLHVRLLELAAKRADMLKKVAAYRHLQQLLHPFKSPQAIVQPNLVTKDGELGRELDRMRILLAKTIGKIEALSSFVEGPITGALIGVPSEEQKVANILNRR